MRGVGVQYFVKKLLRKSKSACSTCKTLVYINCKIVTNNFEASIFCELKYNGHCILCVQKFKKKAEKQAKQDN